MARKTIKAVILAGGRGTRLEEETRGLIPKPMVMIGDMPIMAHIIRMYGATAYFDEYVIASGHLGEQIDAWVASEQGKELEEKLGRITSYPTGRDTQTGGRLLRAYRAFSSGLPMAATYGDGLSDQNFAVLFNHHQRMRNLHDVAVTLTAVQPPNRFGILSIDNGLITEFMEKPRLIDDYWVNGGFYIIEPEVFEEGYVQGDQSQWERDVLPVLAYQGRVAAYQHPGWWHMCDTPRDLAHLRKLNDAGDPLWLRWEGAKPIHAHL